MDRKTPADDAGRGDRHGRHSVASQDRRPKVRPSLGGVVAAMPFAILAGVILGVGAVYITPQLLGVATAAYDSVFPVLTMRGELVARDADYVDVHIRGTKHRGEECRLVSVYAYTVRADGLRADAFANRMDQPQAGRLR